MENEFYNSDEMFARAADISNSMDCLKTLSETFMVCRQAMRNVYSRMLMYTSPEKRKSCHIYMDNTENVGGLSDAQRVICVQMYQDAGSGLIAFVSNDGFTYDFDNLNNEQLLDMLEQLHLG